MTLPKRDYFRKNHNLIENIFADAYSNMALNCFRDDYKIYSTLIDFMFEDEREKELKFLDFGTGPGIINNVILGNARNRIEMIAIDNSTDMLNISQKNNEQYTTENKLKLIQGDEKYLDKLTEKFDIIFLRDILHHLPELDSFFKSIMQLTGKNTQIIIEDLKPDADIKFIKKFTNILFDKMENTGFEIHSKIMGFIDSIRSAYFLEEILAVLNRFDWESKFYENEGRYYILLSTSGEDPGKFIEKWKELLRGR